MKTAVFNILMKSAAFPAKAPFSKLESGNIYLKNKSFTNVIKSFLLSIFLLHNVCRCRCVCVIRLMCAHICVVQLAAGQTGGPVVFPFQRVIASQMFLSFLFFALPPPAVLNHLLVLLAAVFFYAPSQSGGTYVVTHFPPLRSASLEIVPH